MWEKPLIVDPHGGSTTQSGLRLWQGQIAAQLLGGKDDLAEARVALMIPPGAEYVATLLGIWEAGGVAVPLALSHPPAELAYVLNDTGASIIVAHPDYIDRLRALARQRGIRIIATGDELPQRRELPFHQEDPRRALILYTSGTTSKPKGVVSTHGNIRAQTQSLRDAWQWSENDHILHVLPLHHIHGIVNVLLCAVFSGATCEFLWPFDARKVWARIMQGGLTLFMAVPTIYEKLIAHWEQQELESVRRGMQQGCREMRLMVSGSAALPVSTLETWQQISGHVLLERYGMTEIGMALSNPLHGRRVPGHVGTPLPGVEVRRADEQGGPPPDDVPGEIEVRGATVFHEYWRQPEATAAAFRDGWFRTGDIAVVQDGVYRILGRSSVDIIKTGGEKVSALEIEEVLRTHPAITQCAVVGVPDARWGERVSACVVLADDAQLTLDELRSWAKQQLAPYKVPHALLVVEELPRNAMGKVQKPAVTRLFQAQDEGDDGVTG